MKLWLYWLVFFAIIIIRYFLFSGGTYLLFYSSLSTLFFKQSLCLKIPQWESIKKDIQLSMISAAIFSCCATFIITEYNLGQTQLYTTLSEYRLWYLVVSFLGILLLQDTCFYFIHRLFHHPLLFKRLHYGHHRSKAPTPWTAFALDPMEALLQGMFLVGVVFIVPLHWLVLAFLLMTMTIWAVLNHLGFELFPSSFPNHWLGRWLIGSTHHSIHHRNYAVHYGLYFTFWDRLLGTHDPDYEKKFNSWLKR